MDTRIDIVLTMDHLSDHQHPGGLPYHQDLSIHLKRAVKANGMIRIKNRNGILICIRSYTQKYIYTNYLMHRMRQL